MYKIVKGIKKIDNEDLVLVTEDRRTIGHVKKIRMRQTVEKCNALNNEVVTAHNVHNFKEKLDKWRQDIMSLAWTVYNTTRTAAAGWDTVAWTLKVAFLAAFFTTATVLSLLHAGTQITTGSSGSLAKYVSDDLISCNLHSLVSSLYTVTGLSSLPVRAAHPTTAAPSTRLPLILILCGTDNPKHILDGIGSMPDHSLLGCQTCHLSGYERPLKGPGNYRVKVWLTGKSGASHPLTPSLNPPAAHLVDGDTTRATADIDTEGHCHDSSTQIHGWSTDSTPALEITKIIQHVTANVLVWVAPPCWSVRWLPRCRLANHQPLPLPHRSCYWLTTFVCSGMEKLGTMPAGGGAAPAAGGAAAAPAKEEAKEVKQEEPEEESDDDMGFGLFD
ncbi:hypothetical protein E2C01_015562 [Portunus trituberculatus]|uniref:60S acidic ribosomal protein P1 n=1 Tax=Portunus trituberculatus TaxID=210409 RepID=A0A5B7DNC5_PORTR|nr:hypothetical protein [Portunus trituberculatus]